MSVCFKCFIKMQKSYFYFNFISQKYFLNLLFELVGVFLLLFSIFRRRKRMSKINYKINKADITEFVLQDYWITVSLLTKPQMCMLQKFMDDEDNSWCRQKFINCVIFKVVSETLRFFRKIQ